nr:DMT family transporter [Desulfopila aestuarii]
MLSDKANQSFFLTYRPIIEVLIGAFMISFSAVWVALADVPPTTSAFYRVFFGGAFLLAAALVKGELGQIHRLKIMPYAFCGFAFALDLYFWHASILFIGPGLATIMGNFQVFLMALCGVLFFKEKLTIRFIISLPLAICGLLLVVGFNWNELPPSYRTGILFGLLTALSYTVFLLLLRRIQSAKDATHRFTPLMFVSLFSALFLGLMLLASSTSFAIPTVTATFSLLALGLFSQAIGWILIATAMPKIRASFTGLVLLLQPSLSFLWDVLFFSRPTSMVHWLGVTITLAAIYLGLTGTKR